MKTEDRSPEQWPRGLLKATVARLAVRIGGSAVILSALVAFVSPSDLPRRLRHLTPS